MRYAYRRWGFGEDIGLRALLELSDAIGEDGPAAFVYALVRDWCAVRSDLAPADHVAPGVVLLELHQRFGDAACLEAALELGALLTSFPSEAGVAVHRRDLDGWRNTIWVDCMALDGPFLARLAHASGDPAWSQAAADALLGYARVLQDDTSGLYHHGFDVATRSTSPVLWGRGNGWALHGLVDTLEALPRQHPYADEARARLARLLDALAGRQAASGLWHTVLDDPTTPLENSTAAFFAAGALKAARLSLVSPSPSLGRMIERAVAALRANIRPDGGLEISNATPIGERATYVDRPLGIYPWGQGPLLLTFTEGRQAGGPPPDHRRAASQEPA
jgi:unsaturated rhamnogalacturonyl hydrolase